MKFCLTSDLHYGFTHNTHNKLTRFFNKIKEENIDFLIIAGDIATTSQHQLKRCLQVCRQILDCKIGIVRGNHDFWDRPHRKDKQSGYRNVKEIYNLHEDICNNLNIDILNENPIKLNKEISIYGFDGWYNSADPNTNDLSNMRADVEGCPTGSFFVNKAWKDFDKILENVENDYSLKKILVTHHNLYREGHDSFGGVHKFLPEVKQNFDILCCGHTHLFRDYLDGNLRILNCGSDYNNPKYIIFEL